MIHIAMMILCLFAAPLAAEPELDENGDLIIDASVINEDVVAAAAEELAEEPALEEQPAEVVVIDGSIETDKEAVDTAVLLIESANTGAWAAVVAGLLSLIVWAVVRFNLTPDVKKRSYTVVSVLVGVAGGVAVGLAALDTVSLISVLIVVIQAVVAAGGVTVVGNASSVTEPGL